jgi:hypothetical protein
VELPGGERGDVRRGRLGIFHFDGAHVGSVDQAPAYPMQMMIAVFDFPAHAHATAHADHVPALHVDHIAGPA